MGKANGVSHTWIDELRSLVKGLALSSQKRRVINNQIDKCLTLLQSENSSGGFACLQRVERLIPNANRSVFREIITEVSPVVELLDDSREDGRTDLAVICALESPELSQVLTLMDEETTVAVDDEGNPDVHTYHKGIFKDDKGRCLSVVAAAQNSMGMTDCAVLATKVLLRWVPKVIAMVGVAGGRPGQIETGQIVVPNEIFNHQSGKLTRKGFEPDPSPVRLDDRTIQRVAQHKRTFAEQIRSGWSEEIDQLPIVKVGPMACGYTVVDKPGAFKEIARPNRKVIAVDMESYALVRALQLCKGDPRLDSSFAFVAKGIMDMTKNKTDKSKAFAAYASARFLFHYGLEEWT